MAELETRLETTSQEMKLPNRKLTVYLETIPWDYRSYCRRQDNAAQLREAQVVYKFKKNKTTDCIARLGTA